MNSSNLILYSFSFLFAVFVGCCNCSESPSALSKISINGQYFVDKDDRFIMFRGINAVQKFYPWVPVYGYYNLTNQTQLDNLKEWGFNVVRLGFMWSGLMPTKGQINSDYIKKISDIINQLAQRGIYVILDLHQDMMSSKFNAYDGVPLWLVNEFPAPKHPYPWPFKNGSELVFQAYFTDACSFAFQCFYNNVSSAQDYFIRYWTTVAQTYKDFPSLLAYELINEPWAGDIWSNPTLFLPGIAGKKNLIPLYDKVYPEIRKYDADTLVFYEPVTWSLMSNKKSLGTGFDHPPGHDPKRTALSWHYYCWIIQIDADPLKNGTYPIIDRLFCDRWQLNDYFKTIQSDVSTYLGGGPTFLTEFGLCSVLIPNQTDPHKFNNEECKYILETSDQHLQSWTYWDENLYYRDTKAINYDLLNLFSRTYPMATNGRPQSLNYDVNTKKFEYIFFMNITTAKQASLATEIFVPKLAYPNGFNVKASSFLRYSYIADDSKLYFKLKSDIIDAFVDINLIIFAQQAKISISPK